MRRVGVVAELLLYIIVFYMMTEGPWPWFENGRNWLNIVAHVVFGAIVAWWYKPRAHSTDEHVHS